jgi:GTPase SAR1 family protein
LYTIFIVGTAGCGKSLLTASFSDWLRQKGTRVVTVNLDSAALTLPYDPEVDIREYFRSEDLMEKYGLGPNGALLLAADLIATEIYSIRAEIESFNPDYVIVDTPGQIELFAFRASGPYVVSEISTEQKVVVYLFDATFSAKPLNYVSNIFLATAVYTRLLTPQVYILSKTDLASPNAIKRIMKWNTHVESLEEALKREAKETDRLICSGIARLISRLGISFPLIPVSSKSYEGFITFHALLTRIFSGGEEKV